MDFTSVLAQAHSPDKATRVQGEQSLQNAENSNFPLYLHLLAQELINPSVQPELRSLAGVLLKNALDPKGDQARIQRWTSIAEDGRNAIKGTIYTALAADLRDARQQAARCVAKIAVIELPKGMWSNLIQTLVNNVTDTSQPPNVALISSSLLTLGYICEELDPQAIGESSNQILTAVIHGMRPESGNQDIILNSCQAFFNALEFVKDNFDKENERNYIMQTVVNTINIPDEKIRIMAYQCLVQIAQLYYSKLLPYIETIFTLTMESMKSPSEGISRQAIEFWTTIAEQEIEILDEMQEGTSTSSDYFQLIDKALAHILPVLLELMTKQPDDEEEDEFTSSMSAGTCLGFCAQVSKDKIVEKVIPFIQSSIGSDNWRFREAAALTLGQVLDGPSRESLSPLLSDMNVLGKVIEHLKDQSLLVRETSAWVIGRICLFYPICFQNHLGQLIPILTNSLQDSPRVVSKICFAIHNLGLAFEEENGQTLQNSPLSPFFQHLVQSLLVVAERPDANEHHLTTDAYESINILIQHSAVDCKPTIHELIPLMLSRLEATLSACANCVTAEEKQAELERQRLICGVLQTITLKIDKEMIKYGDLLMTGYLKIMNNVQAISEDVLTATGIFINIIEEGFEKYVEFLREPLFHALQNWKEYSVCAAAVSVAGDLCRAITKKIAPFCDELVRILLELLRNPEINRIVKPIVFSCIGDLAMALDLAFERYSPHVLPVLHTAAQLPINLEDEDLVEYSNELRESILEAYTGIFQALRQQPSKLEEHIPPVLFLIDTIAVEHQKVPKPNALLKSAVALLGDLGGIFGSKLRPAMTSYQNILPLIRLCSQSNDPTLQQVTTYAQSALKK